MSLRLVHIGRLLRGLTRSTAQGYADFLYKTEQAKRPGLKLKKLGCLGESTSSMIKGGPFCPYAGTQLGDAVSSSRRTRSR